MIAFRRTWLAILAVTASLAAGTAASLLAVAEIVGNIGKHRLLQRIRPFYYGRGLTAGHRSNCAGIIWINWLIILGLE